MNRYTFKRHRFPPQVIALKRIVNPGKGFYTPPENPRAEIRLVDQMFGIAA